jgi:sensor c-di-GMP phosphodiesterase-like protein
MVMTVRANRLVDELKIAMSFVEALGNNSEDEAIAGTIASVGRALKINVVAEGPETDLQAGRLLDLGRSAQGYLFRATVPLGA